MKKINVCFFFLLAAGMNSIAQTPAALKTKLDQQVKEIEPAMIEWRRYFHQNPELSNREFKTGARIAEQLRSFGIEVQYPVAKTGVVGLLKGGKPGPVMALRADIDALPVTERNSLPFASTAKSTYNGVETGVMHACGHDGHMSILLAVAKILAQNKNELAGTVKFIFQPGEEGAPPGEEDGAVTMIKEGVLENPKVDVIFGLHLQSLVPLGTIAYKPEGLMAAVDGFNIKVTGKGAHGATPWEGVDPIVISSQIVTGLQTIVSRQLDLTHSPAVITVGNFHSGIRRNIIPEEARMEGTIRTFDVEMQKKVHERIKLTANKIAESSGAQADVSIEIMYPLTYNDIKLTQMMAPSLHKTAGQQNVKITAPVTMGEDFSFFQQKIPGFFFFVGAYPENLKPEKKPTHHTADFMIDEQALSLGVKSLLALTTDYMFMKK